MAEYKLRGVGPQADLASRLRGEADAHAGALDMRRLAASMPASRPPGRYMDMQLQIKRLVAEEERRKGKGGEGARTGLTTTRLLQLYTAQSSTLNVACLLSSLVPEMGPWLMAQTFQLEAGVTFRDYMADMDAVFARARPPRPAGGAPYKDLVLFRAVDLFDLPRGTGTVYSRQLPYDIVNHTLCSTSVRLTSAAQFLKLMSPCCMLRVTVPAQFTRMLALKPLSLYPGEEEVLLPRGSVFRVHSRRFVRWMGDNVAVLEADVRWEPELLAHTGWGAAEGGGVARLVDLAGGMGAEARRDAGIAREVAAMVGSGVAGWMAAAAARQQPGRA